MSSATRYQRTRAYRTHTHKRADIHLDARRLDSFVVENFSSLSSSTQLRNWNWNLPSALHDPTQQFMILISPPFIRFLVDSLLESPLFIFDFSVFHASIFIRYSGASLSFSLFAFCSLFTEIHSQYCSIIFFTLFFSFGFCCVFFFFFVHLTLFSGRTEGSINHQNEIDSKLNCEWNDNFSWIFSVSALDLLLSRCRCWAWNLKLNGCIDHKNEFGQQMNENVCSPQAKTKGK